MPPLDAYCSGRFRDKRRVENFFVRFYCYSMEQLVGGECQKGQASLDDVCDNTMNGTEFASDQSKENKSEAADDMRFKS